MKTIKVEYNDQGPDFVLTGDLTIFTRDSLENDRIELFDEASGLFYHFKIKDLKSFSATFHIETLGD